VQNHRCKSIDIVVKWSRVGEDIPADTFTLARAINAEFNSPFEEFSLVEELRSGTYGSRTPWVLAQKPLAIYVPPERMQLWQTGRSRDRIMRKIARHASAGAVEEHVATLLRLRLLRPEGDGYSLTVQAESLGPTLEWFVAEVLRRELGFCVGRGIPLRGGATGGDLDVVGLAEGKLLLVEVKSGPPKHLSAPQIAAFLDRVVALAPQGAIFFEDTELRMADKVVVLFEEVLAARGWSRRPERLQRELFTVGPGIYISNAHPEVVGNLTCCVSHLLRAQGLRLW
jgi:hypothetical protein